MYPDDRNRRDHLLVNAFEVARLRARERERERESLKLRNNAKGVVQRRLIGTCEI